MTIRDLRNTWADFQFDTETDLFFVPTHDREAEHIFKGKGEDIPIEYKDYKVVCFAKPNTTVLIFLSRRKETI